MKDFPLQRGFEQFLKAVNDMIKTDYKDIPKVELLYKKQPFKASQEVIKASEKLIKTVPPVFVDNHGKFYRFLRRCKRFAKSVINKMKH